MLTKQARAALERAHARYGDFCQTPRSDSTFMAQNGHPDAATYRALRRFFDTLRYAANGSARYFSYRSDTEHSQYWAPDLDVTWRPNGFAGIHGEVYPALGEKWDAYLQAAANARWPKSLSPGLCPGQWIVCTNSTQLRNDLALNLNWNLGDFKEGAKEGEFTLRLPEKGALKAHRVVVRLLRHYHKGAIIAPRTSADDAADRAPLALHEKRLLRGNVERVTVTERHVLVPLVPMDGTMAQAAAAVATDLKRLVDQGYPDEPVRHWAKSFSRVLPAHLQFGA